MKIIFPILLLLLLSCKSNNPQIIQAPPNLEPIIEEVAKSNIEPVLKSSINVALRECKAYSDKCYADNQDLNDRIAKLERTVAKQQSELETWRTIKRWFYGILFTLIGLFILSTIWKYRSVLLKLAGVPL